MTDDAPNHTPSCAPPAPPASLECAAAPSLYVTSPTPGTGGLIKQRPEDFLVEEIPAYEPGGSGEHIYLFLEKRNLSTSELVRKLATHFGVRRDDVGFAGLKDRFAVTRQLISVHAPGKTAQDFPAIDMPGVTVHWTDQHTNKLRRGHLAGNRFVIRIRDVDPGKVVHAAASLRALARLGAPNRFGEQRFGVLQRNHEIGRALLARDGKSLMDALLGMPAPGAWCPSSQVAARTLYHQGQFDAAIDAMPRGMSTERRALAVLARGGSAGGVVRSLARFEHSFFVTALQSALFNHVLDQRLAAGTFNQFIAGDLAFKHDTGALFAVTDDMLADDQAHTSLIQRLARLEVSPSGPMWGSAMMLAQGQIRAIEERALHSAGVTMDDFARLARARLSGVEGARRPLRVPLSNPDLEAGQDEHGTYIRVTFELPRGAFATSVMHEIIKPPPGQPLTGPRLDHADADESEELSD